MRNNNTNLIKQLEECIEICLFNRLDDEISFIDFLNANDLYTKKCEYDDYYDNKDLPIHSSFEKAKFLLCSIEVNNENLSFLRNLKIVFSTKDPEVIELAETKKKFIEDLEKKITDTEDDIYIRNELEKLKSSESLDRYIVLGYYSHMDKKIVINIKCISNERIIPTIAHELFHAYHANVNSRLSSTWLNRNNPITKESLATFNEYCVADHVDLYYGSNIKDGILNVLKKNSIYCFPYSGVLGIINKIEFKKNAVCRSIDKYIEDSTYEYLIKNSFKSMDSADQEILFLYLKFCK